MKLKHSLVAAAVVAVAGFTATPTEASTISITNALQLQACDDTNNCSTFDDTGAESATLTDIDGSHDNSFATLLLEIAGNANVNYFGIYNTAASLADLTNSLSGVPGSNYTLQVFSGPQVAGTHATIAFNVATGQAALNCDFTDGTCTSGVKNIGTQFGFYIQGPGGTFFSQSALNGGLDQALIFNTVGNTNPNNGLDHAGTVVAFNDNAGGDRDFNDLVVGLDDVTPVPEPGSMMLLGTGLFGAAGAFRRRLRKS